MQEVAWPFEEGAVATLSHLKTFHQGCSEALAALKLLEAKNVPLRVPYAYQMILVAPPPGPPLRCSYFFFCAERVA